MSWPNPLDVATLLGLPTTGDGWDSQIILAMTVVTDVARAYTRGEGFSADYDCSNDIASVIVLATGRLLRNPSQLPVREQYGAIVVDYRGGFSGWSLAELAVLNRYRVRAH